MSAIVHSSIYTPAQYLMLERKAETKSEYINGRIYAMTGASRAHNLIAANTLSELHTRLKGRSCEAYSNDMRVQVSAMGMYTYPDVVIVCGKPQFEDKHVDTLLNPTVIVEVLSPSTEAYDRGEKFAHYRRLGSLQEYILIDQTRMRVEQYTRQGEQWLLTEFDQPDNVLALPSLGCEVPLHEIYARVQLPDPEAIDIA